MIRARAWRCLTLGLVSLACLCFFLPAAGLAQQKKEDKKEDKKPEKKKKRAEPVNLINDAYTAIKSERRKLVDKYVEALFEIADECVKKKLVEPGRRFTDLILKLVEPPKNRRKVQTTASGVAVDDGGERQGVDEEGQPKLREVKQRPLSPEDEARLKAVRERVKGIREALGIKDDPAAGASPKAPAGPGDGSDIPRPEPKKGKTAVAKKPGEGAEGDGAAGKAEAKGDGDLDGREKSARRTLMRGVEKLVVRCVEQGFPAHGYEILLWALEIDPENVSLRRLVRQEKYKTKSGKIEWYGPFEMEKVKQGYSQHQDYGWVTPVELKALKEGKLWFKGQWQPREKVEAERQKWENRWSFETEHFIIDTNADLSDVVTFGREVERLYAFFFRVFIDFYSTGKPAEDSRLVFGGGKDLQKQKLKLHYYRSREHFLSEIAKDPECNKFPNPPGKDPLIAQSAGFYWGATHKAYFYRGPNGPDLSVIYHEVTHQVFGETYNAGVRPPVWLIEGFGVFMEDPIVRGERLLAGAEPPPGVSKSSPRDINDFVKNYQNHDAFHGGRRGSNYSTGGAAVHFFMFYKGGLYRKGFMQYAREAYRNSQDNSPTEIKKLYEYLKVTEEQLQGDWEAFNSNPDLFDF